MQWHPKRYQIADPAPYINNIKNMAVSILHCLHLEMNTWKWCGCFWILYMVTEMLTGFGIVKYIFVKIRQVLTQRYMYKPSLRVSTTERESMRGSEQTGDLWTKRKKKESRFYHSGIPFDSKETRVITSIIHIIFLR